MNEFAPHRARKRFGQNFLHDHGVINRILRGIAPREGQHLVDGLLGVLEMFLLESAHHGVGVLGDLFDGKHGLYLFI